MVIQKEEELRHETVKEVARKMLLAARTAPKGRGKDNTALMMVEGDDIKKISVKLKAMGEELDISSFIRDADNILSAQVMLLFGTSIEPMGLKKCGMCGFPNCSEKDKHKEIPCSYNTGDLGIAIGSAVSVAMDNRVDNRIMYTVGQAVIEMGLLGENIKVVYAVPLSATSKNPFFDRK